MRKTFLFFIFSLLLATTHPLLSKVSYTPLSREEGVALLEKVHSELELLHGNLGEEYPEQLMAARFISPKDKVLELGGNMGRNSCVIAKILKDSRNLVTLESSPSIAEKLIENRDHNGLKFFVEASAISKVPLVQNGWVTKPGDVAEEGFTPVSTITFKKLKAKYKIKFNVLVVDCEGALYQILKDDESILKGLRLIIVENDYPLPDGEKQYKFVKEVFEKNGFKSIYNEAGPDFARGWFPTTIDFFYQVWQHESN